MIVLSVGMPRAGSGWYYNLTNDLVLAGGGQDARLIRRRYHLQRVLTEVNCNIGALTTPRLLAVLVPSWLGNTFVVKAHAGPTPWARRLIERGRLHPAYIYRDPRDALLSAYENGQRAIEKGRPNAFSHLVDFDAALDFMSDYVSISEAWLGIPAALHTRYEDLLGDYDHAAARLVEFLKLDPQAPAVRAAVEQYRPKRARGAQGMQGAHSTQGAQSTQGEQNEQSGRSEQKGLHFSKGKTGRFRSVMSAEEQQAMQDRFGAYLAQQGYE